MKTRSMSGGWCYGKSAHVLNGKEGDIWKGRVVLSWPSALNAAYFGNWIVLPRSFQKCTACVLLVCWKTGYVGIFQLALLRYPQHLKARLCVSQKLPKFMRNNVSRRVWAGTNGSNTFYLRKGCQHHRTSGLTSGRLGSTRDCVKRSLI